MGHTQPCGPASWLACRGRWAFCAQLLIVYLSFTYYLPCAQLRLGTVGENKQEAEPEVWQAPHRELAPAPKRKKGSNSQP